MDEKKEPDYDFHRSRAARRAIMAKDILERLREAPAGLTRSELADRYTRTPPLLVHALLFDMHAEGLVSCERGADDLTYTRKE